MSCTELEEYAREQLSRKRYNHTVGVVEVSKDLAIIHNENVKSAEIAAWFHDIAKEYTKKELKQFCIDNDIKLDKYITQNINLSHGMVAAKIAKDKWNIEDNDILQSIRNHTLARSGMSNLEKIIYLADIIEPGRDEYAGLDKLRSLSYNNLDKAMALALELNISYLTKKNKKVHPSIYEIKKEYEKYDMEGINEPTRKSRKDIKACL